MPRAASSIFRFVPLLLASVLFSSPAWAACAPEAGQEQQQTASGAPAQADTPVAQPAAA